LTPRNNTVPSTAAARPFPTDARALVERIHAAALDRHARDPVALDVHELSTITDAHYVCHADSTRAVEAIADHLLETLQGVGQARPHVEGMASLQWVLLDLGNVMVHVFLKERREYYQLERLWHDAPRLELAGA
jgi:ribosome-associated protein